MEHTSLPLCFDFLPDGRLLLVSNQERALLTLEADGTLATYADLTAISDLGLQRHRGGRSGVRVREQPALRLRRRTAAR